MRRLVLALVASLLAAPLVGVAGGVREAAAATADDRAMGVARLERDRARLDLERAQLEKQLAARTAEIAGLKKQRASWSRDQKLAKRLREAKDLALALDQKAKAIRALDAQLQRERSALVAESDRELGAAPTPARRAQLERWKREAQGKLGVRKRVEVTEPSIDPLDDPEDLDEKAATLADSEQRLRDEELRLERREAWYRKQAKLQRARQREREQDLFSDEPRRGGGAGGNGKTSGETAADDSGDFGGSPPAPSAPGADSPPPAGGGAGAEVDPGGDDPSVVYADVVDPATLAELERAERSGDPETKAKAAARARADLKARADRLRAKRLQMEQRARQLRERGE